MHHYEKYTETKKEGWEVEDLCNSCIRWLNELLIENGVKITKIDIDW